MQDRLRFRIAVFERYNSSNIWVFQKYIEDDNTWHLTTCGDIAHVPCYAAHYRRDNAPDSVNMVYEAQFCTGLKDKNGKLIYEGDILGDIYESLYVYYCNQCKQFQLYSQGYGCMACNGDVHWIEIVEDNKKLKVIGNIYENFELLEV